MMLERIGLVIVLAIAGYIAYGALTRRQLRHVAASADTDPILRGLVPGKPAIVYFTTPTCIPCKTRQAPALDRLQAELTDLQVVRIDATENTEAANRWGVLSVPTTFIIDRSGHPRDVNHGVADANKLRQQLQAANA
jgi:thiol-disulfide isomerase/thioredoxin